MANQSILGGNRLKDLELRYFAHEYTKDENGWIKFPSDQSYRKGIFPLEVNQHPAKANVFLVQSIIEYVSEPGDTILDCMAGTGTIMVGALIGREVVCVEISEKFHNLQLRAVEQMESIAPGVSEHITCINLPCQTFLPIPNFANHIIFSPQYAGILKKGENYRETDRLTREKQGSYDFSEYSKSSLNLGTMSEFLWKQEMGKVYKKCYDTLTTPGSMTLITKDHIDSGERVGLTQMAIDTCTNIGFKYNPIEHFKWKTHSMAYTNIRASKGLEVVWDEDIVMLRKL